MLNIAEISDNPLSPKLAPAPSSPAQPNIG